MYRMLVHGLTAYGDPDQGTNQSISYRQELTTAHQQHLGGMLRCAESRPIVGRPWASGTIRRTRPARSQGSLRKRLLLEMASSLQMLYMAILLSDS